MSRLARLAALTPLALGTAAVIVLAMRVARERGVAERPRLSAGMFVPLTGARPPLGGHERWVVAINLQCPHCRSTLETIAASPAARACGARVTALVVDTMHRPPLEALPTGEVWWDVGQVWRDRWGRRVYGEVLCFDAGGRCVRVLPPETWAHAP